MVSGLLVALALGAPPESTPTARPGSSAAHLDAVTRYGVAVMNAHHDRLLTAAKQLETAAKQDPDAVAPLRELVRVYSQVGREPDAIRVAREVVKKDPKDVDTAHRLAKLLFDAGELKEALAVAKAAVEVELPADRADKAVAMCRDLATIAEKANDLASAETALRKAVAWVTDQRKEVVAAAAFAPVDADLAAAECLERLGKVQTKRGNFGDAAESFSAAAKLYADPLKVNDAASAARLDWNLSGVLQAKGEPAAALKHLEPFLKFRPRAAEPYARYAQLLRDAGRGDEALPRLRRFAEADPKNLPLRSVLGAELARDPLTLRDADTEFNKLMTETNDPKVVEVVVRSHLDGGRPRDVVAMLDRAFTVLKDRDDDGKPNETPATAEARAFAAEKARVVGDILRADQRAALAVLRGAAEDVRAGKKRTHQVHYFLGQLASRHRQLELAAREFDAALRNAPRETTGDAYSALIDVLVMAHKPAELRDLCRQGLQNAQDISPHYFNYFLAQALAELGDEKGAIAAVDKAIDQTAVGDRLTVRLQKMFVLRSLAKWDDAIALGKKLLDEFDSPADRLRIRYGLAGAYWGAKKAEEAEAELRAILDAEPDHAVACNDLGFHLADQGRNLDEAERLVRTAIASDRLDRKKGGNAEPENAAYIDSLGWVLFRRGKFAEAKMELERAAALPAGAADPVVWDHLGDVLFRSGEKPKAKAAWEKALELYEADTRTSSRGRRDGRLDEVKVKLKRVP
jgi:tetratricopeptide (TPR) repeat protein